MRSRNESRVSRARVIEMHRLAQDRVIRARDRLTDLREQRVQDLVHTWDPKSVERQFRRKEAEWVRVIDALERYIKNYEACLAGDVDAWVWTG